MKEKFAEALVNILKIKSIVTLITTAVFSVMALRGDIDSDNFMYIFFMIIGFYFGTQKIKENEGEVEVKKEDYSPINEQIEYDATYSNDND